MKFACLIAMMALITFATKAVPFACMQAWQRNPTLQRLSRLLPCAVMVALVVSSLLDSASTPSHLGGQIAGVACVVLLQAKYHNVLLSIGAGTLVAAVAPWAGF